MNLRFHDASLTWDDASDSLTVWYSPGTEGSVIQATVAASGVKGVVVAQSTYARRDLSALADKLVQSGAISGQTVAWAGPLPDGSRLDVDVDAGVDAGLDVSARATQETSFDGVPVHIVASGKAVAASRDYDMTPFIAGADMFRDMGNGYITKCTTAFAFNHFDLTTHVSVEQLFTADHCTPSGAVWRTGSNLGNPTIGTAVGATTAGSDIAVISGQDYDPYVYYGANTSNSAVAIFGYVTPIVGGLVCYSGAPSGTVCDNKVTDTGLTVTYGGGLTYQDLTRTVQTAGVSAVGNGDSGGPAFIIDPQGYVYAAGIISGMQNAGSSCQGDPAVSGGRQCSSIAFFAPVSDYFFYNELDSIQVYPGQVVDCSVYPAHAGAAEGFSAPLQRALRVSSGDWPPSAFGYLAAMSSHSLAVLHAWSDSTCASRRLMLRSPFCAAVSCWKLPSHTVTVKMG